MAIDVKTSFLKQVERKFACTTSQDLIARILSSVADVLEHFDIKETTVTESQEDVTTCYLDALRIIGRSEKTLERYEKEIKMFLDYVKIPGS